MKYLNISYGISVRLTLPLNADLPVFSTTKMLDSMGIQRSIRFCRLGGLLVRSGLDVLQKDFKIF